MRVTMLSHSEHRLKSATALPYGTKTGAREVPLLPICRRYATKKGAREVAFMPKFVDG